MTTTVNRQSIDDSKRHSTFYQLTNELSKEEFSNIQTEWKEIELFPLIETSTAENFEKITENLEELRNTILPVFDYTITSLEIVSILYSGINNLMTLVVNYIYQTIYNQLDMLLRTGIYSLTVIPDFQDVKGLSLPTTSLPEQAENAYKKFYDFSDPDVPYNFTYPTKATDDLFDEGNRFIDRLDAVYDKSADNKYISTEDFFNLTKDTNKPYFQSNFKDLQARMDLLSKPNGLYEGVFLYFNFDIKENLQAIPDFIDSISKFSFFFENKSLTRLADRIIPPKVKKIRVFTFSKIEGLEVSKKQEYEKDVKYSNPIRFDPELRKKIFIVPYANGQTTEYNEIKKLQKASVINCFEEIKEETEKTTLYYRYIDRISRDEGDEFFNKMTDEHEFYTYEIEVEIDKWKEVNPHSVTSPLQQSPDYFKDTVPVAFYKDEDFLGVGHIVETMPREIHTDAKGNWFGTSFTDLVGLTDNIKSLQNYVAGTKNIFESNLFALDELIADLKTLRADIVRNIDMLEAIINLLNIRIEFSGNVHAKYVREENYDKFASYLTDWSGAPPTPMQLFKPSANATIREYINKLKELQREHPRIINQEVDIDQLIEQIDEEYGNDNPVKKDLESMFDPAVWGVEEPEVSSVESQTLDAATGVLIAGPVVVEQLTKKIANSVWELGSSAYDLVKDVNVELPQADLKDFDFTDIKLPQFDFSDKRSIIPGGSVSSEIKEKPFSFNIKLPDPEIDDLGTGEVLELLGFSEETDVKKHVRDQYNGYVLLIKDELRKATADLSSEFGFSQVFVSYLPKGFAFRPVAMLAKALGLVAQDGGEPETSETIEALDRNRVNEKFPKNTIQDSERTLKSKSRDTSTATGFKEVDVQPIQISELTEFYDSETIETRGEITLTGKTFTIGRAANITTNYFGVRATKFSTGESGIMLEPGTDQDESDDTTYTYVFEFGIEVNINRGFYDDNKYNRPRLSKIRVSSGLIRKSADTKMYRTSTDHYIRIATINNNDDSANEFKFGQLNKKKFTAQIKIPREELGEHKFYPFFSVHYNAAETSTHYFDAGAVFKIEDEFKLYRTN